MKLGVLGRYGASLHRSMGTTSQNTPVGAASLCTSMDAKPSLKCVQGSYNATLPQDLAQPPRVPGVQRDAVMWCCTRETARLQHVVFLLAGPVPAHGERDVSAHVGPHGDLLAVRLRSECTGAVRSYNRAARVDTTPAFTRLNAENIVKWSHLWKMTLLHDKRGGETTKSVF